jgi:hypothetical protein
MIIKLASIFLAGLTVSCSSVLVHSTALEMSSKLDPAKGVLVATPENGWFETIEYKGSGRMTASAVRDAFASHCVKVDVASLDSSGKGVSSVSVTDFGYFIVPLILHWEDRNTEWSGKLDRIEIQLSVFDTTTKEEIANSSFSGKSKWATFGGDHPQDLLSPALVEMVGSFYK